MGFFKNLRQGLQATQDPAYMEQVAAAQADAMAQAQAVYASLGMTMPTPGAAPVAPVPVRAPGTGSIEFTRIRTRGGSQLEELAAFLGESGLAAVPERVYGVYRVPDRIDPTHDVHSEKRTPVEWEVVHEPVTAAPCPAPRLLCFEAKDQWVARRDGEPSVFDEDLGLALLAAAGIGPERCLGLARVSEFSAITGRGNDMRPLIATVVRELVAVLPDDASAAFAALRDARPLPLPPPHGVHCEVLHWGASGTSPQELLRAYLEVVGIRASDCYSAQATVDAVFELDNRQPERAPGCEQVVVVYRDRPEYAAGRERWPRPDLCLRARRPLEDPDRDVTPGMRKVWRAVETANSLTDGTWADKDVPPYRYCWPLIKS